MSSPHLLWPNGHTSAIHCHWSNHPPLVDSEAFACQRCTDVRFVFLDPVFHIVCGDYYPLLGRESVRDAIWPIEYVRFPRLEKAIGAEGCLRIHDLLILRAPYCLW